MTDQRFALVGDVGGTNARFGLVSIGDRQPRHIEILQCADYPNLADAITAYLEQHQVQVDRASIAFACPVHRDLIEMTNNHWAFSRSAVQQAFGWEQFKCLNDFTAMALGVPLVEADQRVQVGGGEPVAGRPKLVIGPGTGLGVSALVPSSHAWIPLATEGGHVDFAPGSPLEVKVLEYLWQRFPRVSVERILCGEGLVNLYQALANEQSLPVRFREPAEITQAAVEQTDPVAREALSLFCAILGQVAGDAVLTLGALGGVYVCGGIVPRFIDFFKASDFRTRFDNKGRMRHFVEPVPVYVVTEPLTGLYGAAAALTNAEV